MATSPFPELKKAVKRLIKAEVAHSWMGCYELEADRIAVQQELDNAKTNYRYRLEKLRMAFYTKEVV